MSSVVASVLAATAPVAKPTTRCAMPTRPERKAEAIGKVGKAIFG